MYNWLFLGIFFCTSQLFAVFLNDDRGYIDYQDFLAIQKNHNLFGYKNNFYQLEISDSNLRVIEQERRVLSDRKINNDYRFSIGLSTNYFFLRRIDSLYNNLLSNFPAALTMPLIYESDSQLKALIKELSDNSLCQGCALSARYYVAWEILALRGDQEAKNKLAEDFVFLQDRPQLMLGGSPYAHKKIENLLRNRSALHHLKTIKKSRSEKKLAYLERNEKNGLSLPLKYYKTLDSHELHFEALEAIKHPDWVMGNSFSANKEIRSFLWNYLTINHSKELIKLIFSYGLIVNKNYISMSQSTLALALENEFDEWKSDPFATELQELKDYVPYSQKPENQPQTPEDYAYAVFHAMVCQDQAPIMAFREHAQKIIEEGLNEDSLNLFVCFLALLEASELPLNVYTYLIDHRAKYNCIQAFLEHTAAFAVHNSELFFGNNDNENKLIRILLMSFVFFDRTQKQFDYAEKMLLHPNSHDAALSLLFDYNKYCETDEIVGNLTLYTRFQPTPQHCFIDDSDDDDSDYDDSKAIWQYIPVAVLHHLKNYKKNPLYKEDITTIIQQYKYSIDDVLDPEAKRFLRTYLDKDVEGISHLFDS